MSSSPMEIGARIKAARKAAGLNQTQLAERLDKTMRTIQKYESGEIEPSISMINEIARKLNVSPAYLIGYQHPGVRMESISDVLAVLYELNKKADIRFEIEVKKPPQSDGWTCSLRFDGADREAPLNASLCMILERFSEERGKLEGYWSDQDYFDHWVEKELAYYADTRLTDRVVEPLTNEERIRRLLEADKAKKKAAGDAGDQGE